ncbi:60S ribosomal protein L7-1 [Impatiens glandulifera]|uniref:60S ribosomal protein L7-1 n=1 Tax=Impatiens glandulifera TaxID=253017 RepID=UPI001FB125BA|nr:60S ribosomal protein L7-1 [Impatiens glandulifera]
MGETVPFQLDYVPETILKKRRNNEEWAIKRKLQLQQRVKKSKGDRSEIKKPEQFIREFRERELDFIQMKSRSKRQRRAPVMAESKLIFVTRIRGTTDMHPTTRKILYTLRLRKIFSGVFLKANDRTMDLLLKVQPFVTFGYPNLKSVRDLIFKKGVGKFEKQKIPLTDNNIIEQALGQYGMLSIEDLVHEIANVGKHFKEINGFLCPFILNKPEKALTGKKKLYKDGGDTGNREIEINDLISKMN